MFCLNGDEAVRQIGPNYDGLIEKYQKIQQVAKLQEKDKKPWTPYGSRFESFYK